MGDVSTIQRPPGTAAKGDQVGELVSAGWTNDSHNMYISSMEASFMQQLRRGQQHHAADRNMTHVDVGGGHGLKSRQEGASDNVGTERNVSRSRDVGARGLPEDPWARRFKPRDSVMNRRGDWVGASDGESGTDTVHATVPKHGRRVSSCVGGNLVDKSSEVSGQNFPEDEVHSAAQPSKSCKKRRPASSTAAGSFISMLGDKRW